MTLSRPRRTISLLTLTSLLLAAPALASRSQAQAKVDPELSSQMSTSNGSDLAVYVHGVDTASAERAVAESGLRLIDTFEQISVTYAIGDVSQIQRASKVVGVTYLEADPEIDFFMQTSHAATRGEDAYRGFTVENVTSSPVDGSGVGIAIVDSGIDGTHPMFTRDGTSKVVRNLKLACHQIYTACTGPNGDANDGFWVDATASGNDTDTASAGGHGTHVAGIAAGLEVSKADGQTIHGAAPGAKLVGLSIGQAVSIYGGNAGLNWVAEHHQSPCGTGVDVAQCPPIRVVNNSWGTIGGGEFDPASVTSKLSDLLVGKGITVVFAAGNGDVLNDGGTGTDNRVNPPAQNPTPGVIGVANYDDFNTGNRDGSLDTSSSRGRRGFPNTYPDISAPGSSIESACRPQLAICSASVTDPDYGSISGTSMAAPHIAGIAAQLLQASPTLTPGQIEELLEDTAHKFAFGAGYEADPRNADNTTSYDKGHGLVDVAAAMATLRSMNAPFLEPLCTPGGAVIVDKGGDAKDLAAVTGRLESEPSLDILESRLSWQPDVDPANSSVTFKIKVQDLGGQAATQQGYTFTFVHGAGKYYVDATTKPSLPTRFTFGTYTSTLRKGLVAIAGEVDVPNDEIRLVLTNSDLERANPRMVEEQVPTATAFTDGAVLHQFSLTAGRQAEARLPDEVPPVPSSLPSQAKTRGLTSTLAADSAEGQCPFTLGLGAVYPPNGIPEPPLPPPPAPDGSISGTNPTYSWTGNPQTDVFLSSFNGGCNNKPSNKACEKETVQVDLVPGETNTLTFSITNDQYQGFWLYVYAPDGSLFGSHAPDLPSSRREVKKTATQSGVYTVVVQSEVAVNGSYQGSAVLSIPTSTPPGGVVHGELAAVGDKYDWSTGPTVSARLGDCGPAPTFAGCEVKRVRITVPAGGATLNISIDAELPDVNDYDFYVYDPAGSEFDKSTNGGSAESISKAVTVSGVYTIVINPWLTAGSTYAGVARLT